MKIFQPAEPKVMKANCPNKGPNKQNMQVQIEKEAKRILHEEKWAKGSAYRRMLKTKEKLRDKLRKEREKNGHSSHH